MPNVGNLLLATPSYLSVACKKPKTTQDFRPNGGQAGPCSCSCIHGRLTAISIANGEGIHK